MVKVGDKLPSADLFEGCTTNKINICDLIAKKNVIIFGVLGAFTPGCSEYHLPDYIRGADKLKSKYDVQEIFCVSVNDPFVMSAWGRKNKAHNRVRMLADPNAEFAKALDLAVELPRLGGLRCKRFSMIVRDGVIKELNVEPDGTGLSCTLATRIGKSP